MENMHTDVEVYLVNSREIIVSIFNVINLSSKCCLLLELHFTVAAQISFTIFHHGNNNYVVYGTHLKYQ